MIEKKEKLKDKVEKMKEKETQETSPKIINKIPEINPSDIRAVSPNYFISHFYPNKFIKGSTYSGDRKLFRGGFDQDLDGKIRVYEDRIKGWFLDHAKTLIKEEHADFVVLMICTSYLEGNQQFREGRASTGDSGKTIKRALRLIFPVPEENRWIFDTFVEDVRQGLFHDGMTRNRVSISRKYPDPFAMRKEAEKDTIIINPILFLWAVEEDFKEYINDLRNPDNKELRDNFENHWKERYESN